MSVEFPFQLLTVDLGTSLELDQFRATTHPQLLTDAVHSNPRSITTPCYHNRNRSQSREGGLGARRPICYCRFIRYNPCRRAISHDVHVAYAVRRFAKSFFFFIITGRRQLTPHLEYQVDPGEG